MERATEARYDWLEVEGIMSKGYGVVSKKVMCDRSLTIDAKCVYAYLCSHEGGTRAVDPYAIQEHLGMGRRRAVEAVSQLESYMASAAVREPAAAVARG